MGGLVISGMKVCKNQSLQDTKQSLMHTLLGIVVKLLCLSSNDDSSALKLNKLTCLINLLLKESNRVFVISTGATRSGDLI